MTTLVKFCGIKQGKEEKFYIEIPDDLWRRALEEKKEIETGTDSPKWKRYYYETHDKALQYHGDLWDFLEHKSGTKSCPFCQLQRVKIL